ncbi:MAG: hypothetical protein ABW157_01225 [Candidatus Thiodiazotropha sp. LLP2]
MKIGQKKTLEAFNDLNESFWMKAIAPIEFYNQLESLGVRCEESILIAFVDDGENTFSGSLVRQDGVCCSFDIDCGDSSYSSFIAHHKNIKECAFERDLKKKRLSYEFLAYKLFMQMEENGNRKLLIE